MLTQFQRTFPKIGEEIISAVLKWFDKNAEETKTVLTWLTENTTNLQQQHHLLNLFKSFGGIFEKTTISQTWKNCNRIFVDAYEKLQYICATSNLNELKEENEIKISREICLHILWNILKYPKQIKYRQIHKQVLYNYLFQKCHSLDINFEQMFIGMELYLQHFGFKKGNDGNWYYQYDEIHASHLWNCYQKVINSQTMYFVAYFFYFFFCYFNK
ncbi:hypothetical protein RFI_08759 [Reticulomyxa filosa]|uniref:Uncharacterized protein n=1 Tax=Reticulomyxa filosa TaxID=46433 RepID=X6NRQ6_RETFI|nr:hypothetical protein RFI_08759 [Reticulomyxa filosa]|eukprot:ETO28374.1 hypothetical protein RFI_08759 [Reticulomyxa filosa]